MQLHGNTSLARPDQPAAVFHPFHARVSRSTPTDFRRAPCRNGAVARGEPGFPVSPLMRRLAFNARRILAPISTATLLLAPFPSLRAAAAAPSTANASASSESVKAAFLVNFLRFTDWPPEAAAPVAPFVIGVSGNRGLEDELLRLADRQLLHGRRLRVVRIDSPSDLADLHAAYFDVSAADQTDALPAAEALALLRGRPVLTVSNSADFISAGGMIRIFREDRSLRFEIAPDTARQAGLVLSSRLLSLANIHRDAPAAISLHP